MLNTLAVQAKFPRREPLARIHGDVESNPDNYDRDGKQLSAKRLVPQTIMIYKGLQVYLTRNKRKDLDFINGMQCTVEDYDDKIPAVRVLTATGHRLAITSSPDEKLGNMRYFPMRYGYASTIMKFAGATLDRVCIWLDRPYVPGAAYTAMSRVRMQEHCLIGGCVKPEHFTPAR